MSEGILDYLYAKSPTQKKKLSAVLARNPAMAADLDRFLNMYRGFMAAEGISEQDLADAYLLMINQVMAARLEFIRTGKYPAASAAEAFTNVYDNRKVMTQYMLGLAFSQFVWEHHYRIFKFFGEGVRRLHARRTFLEVGSGHGLYTLELLQGLRDVSEFAIVDISETSLKLTQRVLQTLVPEKLPFVRFIKTDVDAYDGKGGYDVIVMGEVMEHVESPGRLLKSLHRLLADDGVLFVTTCANCPAIDHVYHFRDVGEIREVIRGAGFRVEEELVAPSENKSAEAIAAQKIDVSYAAFLRKETTA